MAIIYAVSGVLNFAHGDFLSLAMYLCLAAFSYLAFDPYLASVIVIPCMAALGMGFYQWLVRPMVGRQMLMIVQLTLGVAFMVQSGLLMAFGGQPKRVPSVIEAKLLIVGDVVVRGPQLVALGVSVVLAICLYLSLNKTSFGREVRAVQQVPRAAALMGINVPRTRLITFALGFAVLAVAGILLVPGLPIHPSQGLRYTVITLMVVVLGGLTNFVGVLLGGLLIGLAEAFGTVYVSGVSGFVLPYLIFILILLFRPKGLLGGAA
ncbi:MAG: branched-chain amino acid ABC transporter permease [Hyphomicrobiales bacterium]|nr:branched-chain amino acid ABC transporter permease [Hyphomicrobiales bacterium]